MEEKSLQDYDESLRELEQQRVLLERVMEKMGQEWEESGAGIAWLGSLELPNQHQVNESKDNDNNNDETTPSTTAATATTTTLEHLDGLPVMLPTPLDKHTESKVLETPGYVQSLLKTNETLLAQSFCTSPNTVSPPTTPDEYPQSAVFGSIAKTLDIAISSDPVIVSTSNYSQDPPHDA